MWSLGISLVCWGSCMGDWWDGRDLLPAAPAMPVTSQVELATGQFPYKNCKTDFEVLTKVLQEEPPLLPGHMGFSGDFQSFVKDW